MVSKNPRSTAETSPNNSPLLKGPMKAAKASFGGVSCQERSSLAVAPKGQISILDTSAPIHAAAAM